MSLRKYGAFVCAFISFWIVLFCLGCQIAGMKILTFVRRVPQDRFMTEAACACMRWARRAFRLIAWLLSIKVNARYSGTTPIPPCIAISNHVSVLDMVLMPAMLEEHGFANVRWAVKKEVRSVFLLGWIAHQIGSAFLSRDRNPADIEAMRRCGEMTRRQKGGFGIFVEGERATRIDPSKGFKNILPPKPGGFNTLREAMPDAPVLVLTLNYPQRLRGGRSKGVAQAAALYGSNIEVTLQLFPAETVNADPHWLINTWKNMDASLNESE